MYRGPYNSEPAPIPLTAQELMWLHGLTVEEGLRQGYCIKGHEKEWRAARRAAKAEERKAFGGRRREWDYLDKPKKPRKPKKPQPINPDDNRVPPPGEWRQILPKNTSDAIQNTSQTEDFFMDKNTRILLLIHLMSSETFADMPQTEKALLLTELLYGKDKPEPAAAPKSAPSKKTVGRPKKAAAPAAEKTEGDEG